MSEGLDVSPKPILTSCVNLDNPFHPFSPQFHHLD